MNNYISIVLDPFVIEQKIIIHKNGEIIKETSNLKKIADSVCNFCYQYNIFEIKIAQGFSQVTEKIINKIKEKEKNNYSLEKIRIEVI